MKWNLSEQICLYGQFVRCYLFICSQIVFLIMLCWQMNWMKCYIYVSHSEVIGVDDWQHWQDCDPRDQGLLPDSPLWLWLGTSVKVRENLRFKLNVNQHVSLQTFSLLIPKGLYRLIANDSQNDQHYRYWVPVYRTFVMQEIHRHVVNIVKLSQFGKV